MKLDPKDLDPESRYRLLVSTILPRPIAWVSTISEDGAFNLAPFSFFSGVCSNPPMVGFSVTERRGQKKDTAKNVEATGEFVVNLVPESLAQQMNQTAAEYPREVDEFKEAGLTPVKSDVVGPPRVGEAPISMECRVTQTLEMGEKPRRSRFIIGEVVRFHIADHLYRDGRVDAIQSGLIGRLSQDYYCRTGDIFEMKRPRLPE